MQQTHRIFAFAMMSFDNTRIAFSGKSDRDLDRAYWLFKLLSSNILVKAGQMFTPLALRARLPVKGLIKATIFKQFVGGESIADCQRVIQQLGEHNIGTILDYSVEGKESESSFEKTFKELLKTVLVAADDINIPFSVFKVTGIAPFHLLEKISQNKKLEPEEEQAWQRVKNRVEKLCRTGFEKNVPVLIDAEESWIQPAIDELAIEMMRAFNRQQAIVYNTAQMYRHDRLQYVKSLTEIASREGFHAGLKIVRGAYMEKERARAEEKGYPSPIQPDKASTDRDFDAAMDHILNHLDILALCCGTHNEKSSLHLVNLISAKGLPKNHPRIWFSQLLGMSDHISFNLAAEGYNVAKYVPFGPVNEVLPYLIRRANENTSVAGQTGRELNLIVREKTRRKNNPAV